MLTVLWKRSSFCKLFCFLIIRL